MLAFKLLLRNWRSGELKLLTIALIIAVTVVSGISIFTERLEGSLQLETAALLGGDSVVVSPSPLPDEWRQEADKRGIRHADFMRLQTMAYTDEEFTLISLQVVNPGYPLRGSLAITETPLSAEQRKLQGSKTTDIPSAGEIWVANELLEQMSLSLGQSLDVGDASFVISKILVDSPESFTRYPIVMLNQQDLDKTGVIAPGSQVRYRWLLASDDTESLDTFKSWLEEELNPQQEISDAHSRSDWLKRTVEDSSRLLSFSAVMSVLLAGVAISIATRQFVERHVSQVAVKKSFGASTKKIKTLYFGQLAFLGISASLIGVVFGHFMQAGIAFYLQQFVDFALAPTSYLPYLFSFLSGIFFLLLFALPPLWHLPSIPPLRVLRSDLHTKSTHLWVQGLLAGLALFGLIALFSRDIVITLKVSGALIIIVVLTLVFAKLTLLASKKWSTRSRGFWRLGLVNLQRRAKHNTLLIAVFSTTLMALLSLTLVRNDFWQEIRDYADRDEVNVYIMNITEPQKPFVETFLSDLALEHDKLYPTIVGRVTHVNDNLPDEELAEQWIYKWDVWMSWQEEVPEDQALLQGNWWSELPFEPDVFNVSVREDIIDDNKLKLGDVLTFSLAGQPQKAKITSVRPNLREKGFSLPFLFDPKAMVDYDPIYNMGVNVPPEHKRALYQFGREYPTLIIESLDTWLAKTQKILKQALDGALIVLLITLACGCLVMLAAVNSSIASRQQESGLLRAFGSSQKLILGSVWVEFVTVGILSGIIAIVASEVLFHQLQNFMSDVPIILHYEYWLPVLLGGALFVGILGVAACRSTVSTPPSVVLRTA